MPMHDDEEDLGIIPNRIKPLRKERDMTLEQLAEQTGISLGHISNIENHKRGFTTKSLKKIAEALGVKPAELLDTSNAWQDISVLGIIGQKGVVRAASENGSHHKARKINVPAALGETVALVVEGQSLYPRYDDGAILVCSKAPTDPAAAVGRECFVVLSNGASMIRRVEKGASDDAYMLTAHNLPPMMDQEILACRPIILSLPSE
jgi:transcriptional regulator with XRE-family HTH domain